MRATDLFSRTGKVRPRPAVVLLMCLVGGPAGIAHGQDSSNMAALQEIGREFGRIAEQAYPSVVAIIANRSASLEDAIRERLRQRGSRSPLEEGEVYGGPSEPGRARPSVPEDLMRAVPVPPVRQLSRGLGIIVSADGYIVTNNHIVRDISSVEVKLADGRSFQGKVVGADADTDIAVVKIEADGLRALELGDSDKTRLGDWVIGVGNPMGIGWSFSVGLITGKNRSGLGMAAYEDFIQTNAPPTPGDGGGPLLNLEGRVIGINTAVIGLEHGGGIGLAIPINMAKTVYEQLIKTGVVERGFLGILLQDLNAQIARVFGLEEVTGVVIAEITKGSPADGAGLRKGDVIVRVGDEKISSSNQLRWIIAARKPGAQVELDVICNRETKRFTITLAQRPPAK
jgi:serine protease Do